MAICHRTQAEKHYSQTQTGVMAGSHPYFLDSFIKCARARVCVSDGPLLLLLTASTRIFPSNISAVKVIIHFARLFNRYVKQNVALRFLFIILFDIIILILNKLLIYK